MPSPYRIPSPQEDLREKEKEDLCLLQPSVQGRSKSPVMRTHSHQAPGTVSESEKTYVTSSPLSGCVPISQESLGFGQRAEREESGSGTAMACRYHLQHGSACIFRNLQADPRAALEPQDNE